MLTIGTKNESNRKEWLKDTLLTIPKGSCILDAGAGELGNQKYCEHLRYVSQDFCQYDGTGDGDGLQTGSWNTEKVDIVGDIVDIPEESGSFDAVLCSEVFEHIPDPVAAMREFERLLKTGGGVLIITAPFCSLTHFAPYHFSSGFNRYYYQHHLKSLGFEIKRITSNGNFLNI